MMRPAMIVVALLLSGAIHAQQDQRELLYQELIKELRCLVCQNQNIADSNAELALDLRRITREMVDDGASKQDVLDFMASRYGDFVLYRPPFRASTLALWLGPFALLLMGLMILWRKLSNTQTETRENPQLDRAERLLMDREDTQQ